MRRTRGEAGSEAAVEPRRAARRHAWFLRRPDSSRVSEDGLLQRMLSKLRLCAEVWSRQEAEWQERGALPVGEEAEVTDADEAAREQVK